MSVITRLSFQSGGGLWKGIKENHHGDEKFDKKFQWWPPAIIVHTTIYQIDKLIRTAV